MVVAILGAGAWGTAVAVHLARTSAPPAVRLWARDPDQARSMAARRENARYLPGIALPSSIAIGAKLDEAVAGATLLIVATPISALPDLVSKLRDNASAPLVWSSSTLRQLPQQIHHLDRRQSCLEALVARLGSGPVDSLLQRVTG